jgi:hypothetical protein
VLERLLGLAGVAIVCVAALWAAADGAAAPVGTLVGIGVVFALADAAVWRAADDDVDLDVPPGRRQPPRPRSALVLAAAGLGLVAALVANAVPVAIATGLVGGAALFGRYRPRGESVLPARTVNTACRLRAFLRAHGVEDGQPADGYLTTLGEPGTRLVVVAPDGAWADAMLDQDAETVATLARITLREPSDPATGQRLRIGAGLWTRMTQSW